MPDFNDATKLGTGKEMADKLSNLIAADGWQATTYRVIEKDKGWACDLLPKPTIVARYFAAEQAAIEQTAAGL